MITREEVTGAVLGHHMTSFVALASMYGTQELNVAQEVIRRALTGADDAEQELLLAALKFIAIQREGN